ncbi:MAG TPA: rod shape-determining protein MreD [Acidimicrobiia bacterium]|nr:rod shape-determining protein MreD [Acidimicrobiia bacterium]
MRLRTILTLVGLLLVAIVLQTTMFSQLEFFTPDLVMLVAILIPLTKVRPELALLIAFTAGLTVDLLGSAVLGLRGIVFTIVAYLGIRTRDRADIGRIVTALWAGGLTFTGVILLILVGTLFGQTVLLGEGVVDRVLFVPIANFILAFVLAPMFVRLIDRDSTAFRYV